MSKCKIAIIGGGASGLFSASMLASSDFDVTIYEKNNKLGKKILASGNGKCNFTNVNDIGGKYNDDLAYKIISKFSVDDTLKEFLSRGLIYKEDSQGRCYPISESANSVLDCLKEKLNNVRILLESPVEKISSQDNQIVVYSSSKKELYDYVICCTGSVASNLGSDKAYSYLKDYGVKFTEIKPSLVPVIVKEKVKTLSGVRIKCNVSLIDENNECIYKEDGEVLFKDNGLSGIAVFNASSHINRARFKDYKIALDISGGLTNEQLREYLSNKKKENMFKGFLHDKIGEYIYDICQLDNLKYIDNKVIDKIVKYLKCLEFNVVDFYSLRDAQVCSGGVDLNEITENLSLKKNNHIYVGGELLNIDGVCGGYNLQFAWSSAGVIVNDIKEKLNKKSR